MLSSTTVAFASLVAYIDNAPQWFRPSNDGRLRSSRGSSEDNDEERPDGWVDQDLRAGGLILTQSPSVTIYYPTANSLHREIMGVKSELSNSIRRTNFAPLQPFVIYRTYKLGRSTETTRGSLSGLKTAHLNVPDGRGGISEVPTFEYSITSPSSCLFSDPGDSGALVFDYDSNCIGLVFAWNPISRVSYITLLPDLFNDIRIITGAFDVRIAE
ncbi:hypothetical protein MGYG_01639 [Nannizzia gypsea CBS 118893]|uniref:Uncharacterized protein n=1 Tax=Arthroderma gypseum (strain ATCC MYA-4604 / CBS 118893) TaxID=535722 RepID=E5R251_ARTGP|nr:hypothetical protein MGYG_01639 [Nannizzia gypsea CBS 118893]EFQ98615.1 hypothetical protein MGYG_01639 [Nannizzia gypsea CBS 118893]